jgi:hypothetical protein
MNEKLEKLIVEAREKRRIPDKDDPNHYIKKLEFLKIWVNAKIRRDVLDTRETDNFRIITYGPEIWSFEDYFKTQTGEIKLYA